MAYRMKWLIGVAAACALVVVFVRSLDLPAMAYGHAEVRRVQQLGAELTAEEQLLRETVWADTVLRRIPSGTGLHIEVIGRLKAQSDSVLRTAVRQEWERVQEPSVRIAVLVVPDTLGAHHDSIRVAATGTVYYAGTDEGGAYCAAVIPQRVHDELLGTPLPMRARDTNVLGPCRWWARHGPPGAQVAHWLRAQSGYSFGQHRAPEGTSAVTFHRRAHFARGVLMGNLSRYAVSCIQGNVEHCVHTITMPPRFPTRHALQAERGVPIYRARMYWTESHYGGRERHLLAELEREFGRDRFARFWNSDAEVERAFADAFGVPLGEWVQRWARERFPGAREGSGNTGVTLALSLLTLGLLGGAGVVEAQRRQIR